MTVVACIQARMSSTRLPGKILQNLAGRPVLKWVVDAAQQAPGVGEVVVATSDNHADDIVAQKCLEWSVRCVRGSETDVISRFMAVAQATHGTDFIRLTGDCPFHDPQVIGAVVRLYKNSKAAGKSHQVHYASNIDPPTWPDGLDVEIFSGAILQAAHREATRPSDRDCVTRWMARNRSLAGSATLTCPVPGLVKERWVLDTINDMRFCQEVASRLPSDLPTSYLDILDVLDRNPELRQINSMHPRNERFYEGINSEKLGSYSYERSRALLVRAKKIIPMGSQTFSKSYVQFPGNSPLFVSHGDGAYVYDVDGNEYVDLVSGLLPVILGHRDPDVNDAIRAQLDSGITLSLATELEAQLAERIIRLIPSAEQVRFGKNGSDVCSVAVRLARANTGRDFILTSGYHGWGDAFIGDFGDRGRGIPSGIRHFSVSLRHGDTDFAIKEINSRKYACIIVEPETNPEFLQALRDACTETGTILIFDEIITWPRWGIGGAQKYFGITPDLTCLSKAMGNGMPISAICGRADIMKLLEPPDNIFYSGTFQGETLSLAAAIACIDKMERENVVETITRQNATLNGRIFDLSGRHDAPVVFSFTPGLTRLAFEDRGTSTKEQIATLFRQKMAENGVLVINSNNLGYMHRENELKRIVRGYDVTLGAISDAIKRGNIADLIGNTTVSPGIRDSA